MLITLRQACLIFLFYSLFSALSASAQTPPPYIICGTDGYRAKLLATDSTYQRFYKGLRAEANRSSLTTNTLYTIPIVFVVYHLGEPVGTGSNVSDAFLQAAIDTLNRNFAGQYPGESYGIDTKIRFAPARRSTACTPSNGIVRVDARSVPQYQNLGVIYGDNEQNRQIRALVPEYADQISYGAIIVRVVSGIYGVGGWAVQGGNVYVPSYDILNGGNIALTHEIGHSLTLDHTFSGAILQSNGTYACPPNNDPNIDGDQVADTDPHLPYTPYSFKDCSHGASPDPSINPCTGRPWGLLGRNFMSYSCQRLFTQGQVERMRSYLNARGSTLVSSPYLTPPQAAETVTTACKPTSVSAVQLHYDGIWSVSFGQVNDNTFDNTYHLGQNYRDFSCNLRAIVTVGQTYPLEVNGQGRYSRAYIDYNNDGTFDESTERVLSVDYTSLGYITTIMPITIPKIAATNHYLRMRVIIDNGGTPPTACNLPGASYGSGAAKDYGVMILPDPSTCSKMSTVKAGNWNDPSIWTCGRLPTSTDFVEILHEVKLSASLSNQANRLIYGPGGKLNLETGARLVLKE
jgi:hypothetical protein